MCIMYMYKCTCIAATTDLIEMTVREHKDLEATTDSIRIFHLYNCHVVQFIQSLKSIAYRTFASTDMCCHHKTVIEKKCLNRLKVFISLLQRCKCTDTCIHVHEQSCCIAHTTQLRKKKQRERKLSQILPLQKMYRQ